MPEGTKRERDDAQVKNANGNENGTKAGPDEGTVLLRLDKRPSSGVLIPWMQDSFDSENVFTACPMGLYDSRDGSMMKLALAIPLKDQSPGEPVSHKPHQLFPPILQVSPHQKSRRQALRKTW